ncbi:MAG: dynamin family protein [Phototrophicales bacterium]|nr:dynamin family protein [Phototrophicales bacterium]
MTQLEGALAALRESQIDLMTDVSALLAEMGDVTEDDRKRVADVVRDLREMFFLVVIIGEFNAGKSTFVNALLGEDVLPTGITPTTEMIELIRHSPTANLKPITRDESIREWSHPNTGGDGVAIVDTPGTGSVFQRHEKVAKDFLHRSDLVIFLLSAKRAFAETERLYMEMAKNFGKKMILVVNQIDLLQPNEQAQVRRFIEQQVKEYLGISPLIFMVSAKQALAHAKNPIPNGEAGSMDAVKAHLRGELAQASPARQKLLAQLTTAEKLIQKYHDQLRSRIDIVRADTSKVKDVERELQTQSLALDGQLLKAKQEIDAVFAGMKLRGLSFLDANLSIRRVGRGVNKEKLQSEFQEVVVGRSLRDINDATTGYINAVVDQSRVYWRDVIDRLNKIVDLLNQEVSGLDAGSYAEQRESLEEAIRVAEGELRSYSTGRMVDEIQQEFQTNISGFTTSMGATVFGLIGTILSIAGSSGLVIATLPIMGVGGILAYRYYNRITQKSKEDFVAQLEALKAKYERGLNDLTYKERGRLVQYGQQILTPIFSRLDALSKRYAEQETNFERFDTRVKTLRKGLEDA